MDTAEFLLLMENRRRHLAYADKVAGIFGDDLIAQWPLWEASGSVADNYEGTAARDGTHVGVTLGQTGIGDGRTCPYFDGVNDYIDIYSSSLNGVLNGQELTFNLWIKATDWTSSYKRLLRIVVDDDNKMTFTTASGGTVHVYHKWGGTEINVNRVFTETDFVCVGFTCSLIADEIIMYVAGSNVADTSGVGAWVGNLDSANTLIGAENTTPTNLFDGYISHLALGKAPLSPTSMASLAVI